MLRPDECNAACNTHGVVDRHCAVERNGTIMSGGGVDCSRAMAATCVVASCVPALCVLSFRTS